MKTIVLHDNQYEILKRIVEDGHELYIPPGEPTQEAVDEMYKVVELVNNPIDG